MDGTGTMEKAFFNALQRSRPDYTRRGTGVSKNRVRNQRTSTPTSFWWTFSARGLWRRIGPTDAQFLRLSKRINLLCVICARAYYRWPLVLLLLLLPHRSDANATFSKYLLPTLGIPLRSPPRQ